MARPALQAWILATMVDWLELYQVKIQWLSFVNLYSHSTDTLWEQWFLQQYVIRYREQPWQAPTATPWILSNDLFLSLLGWKKTADCSLFFCLLSNSVMKLLSISFPFQICSGSNCLESKVSVSSKYAIKMKTNKWILHQLATTKWTLHE